MRSIKHLVAAAAIFAAPAAFAQTTDLSALEGGTYSLDKSHANIVFQIKHMGFSSYMGRFNDFDATLDFDPANPENSRLEVTVNVASIDTNHEKLEGELRGEKFFKTGEFPTITFVSTGIERTDEAEGTVTGDLTLMGITRPVTLEVTFNGGGAHPFGKFPALGFSASGAIDRTDFGMDFLAPEIVGTEVDLIIEAEFHKK